MSQGAAGRNLTPPASARCADCGEAFSHWNHADKNRAGHLFNSSGIVTLAGRVFASERHPKQRSGTGSAHDSKYWIRTFEKQKLVRDMAAERIRKHELASERMEEESRLRERLIGLLMVPVVDFAMVREAVSALEGIMQERGVLEGFLLTAEELKTCREMASVLTEKLQIRKRPPEEA